MLRTGGGILFFISYMFVTLFWFVGFEIPDSDAERLMSPADIMQYVGDKVDAYE